MTRLNVDLRDNVRHVTQNDCIRREACERSTDAHADEAMDVQCVAMMNASSRSSTDNAQENMW